MKVGALVRYSIYLMVMILITFLVLTVYLYYFTESQSFEMGYSFIVPVCIFVSSILYSKNTKERGFIRGVEIWVIYFAIMCLMKLGMGVTLDTDLITHMIFIPIAILGGVIGVNLKK